MTRAIDGIICLKQAWLAASRLPNPALSARILKSYSESLRAIGDTCTAESVLQLAQTAERNGAVTDFLLIAGLWDLAPSFVGPKRSMNLAIALGSFWDLHDLGMSIN